MRVHHWSHTCVQKRSWRDLAVTFVHQVEGRADTPLNGSLTSVNPHSFRESSYKTDIRFLLCSCFTVSIMGLIAVSCIALAMEPPSRDLPPPGLSYETLDAINIFTTVAFTVESFVQVSLPVCVHVYCCRLYRRFVSSYNPGSDFPSYRYGIRFASESYVRKGILLILCSSCTCCGALHQASPAVSLCAHVLAQHQRCITR